MVDGGFLGAGDRSSARPQRKAPVHYSPCTIPHLAAGKANAKSEYAVPQIISQVYIGSFSPKATDASAKWSLMARGFLGIPPLDLGEERLVKLLYLREATVGIEPAFSSGTKS
jgi:hypothetical protein